MSDQTPSAVPPGPPHTALRLTLALVDGQIQRLAQEPIDATPLPSHPLGDEDRNQSGFWLELQDGANQPIYRRVMHDPFGADAEVFPARPGEPFKRQPAANLAREFSVIVPALEAAKHLVLLSSAAPPRPQAALNLAAPLDTGAAAIRARTMPAREVARFPLA